MSFEEFYKESIDQPHAFWQKEAALVDWQTPFSQVLDYSTPPFAKWFVDGKTNLCHNAIDRWAASQGDSPALIADGAHARADAYVSLAVIASAGVILICVEAMERIIGIEGVGEEPGLKSVAMTTASPASIIARAAG